MTVSKPKKLIGLQWLRGFAALFVVLAHSHDVLEKGYRLEFFDGWVGGIGVDIFFVISGFIMFNVMNGRPAGLISAGEFAAGRIGRIVPIYWVMIVAVTVAWVLTGADMFSRLDESHSLFRFVTNFMFMDRYPIVTVGWTLCFEMMFYALSTLVMVKISGQAGRLAAITLILLVLVFLRSTSGFIWFWLGEYVVLEFAVGGLIWILHDRYWKKAMPFTGVSAISAGLLVIGFCYGRHEYNHGDFPWIIASALLVSGVLMADSLFAGSKWQLPTLLGDASYSLYLIHVFVLFAVAWLQFDVLGLQSWRVSGAIFTIIAVVAVCIISVFIYRRVETPFARATTIALRHLVKSSSRISADVNA